METVYDHSINLQRRSSRMAVPNALSKLFRNMDTTVTLLSLPTRLVLRGTAEARNYTHDLYSQDPQEYDTMVVSV